MISLVPRLPPEVYRDVISTLDVSNSDARDALLSLALASKHLCHESQRVLFESNESIMSFARDDQDAITRHHQFVQAIFNYPARFASFVRKFVQVDIIHVRLAYEPQSYRRETRKRERLWELTVKTLPYLTNLKVLVMAREFIPGTTVIRGCDFQLDILQYQPSRNSDHLLSVVLPTQRRLLHLALYSHAHQVVALLTEHNCAPSLISIECDIQLFGRIARTRKITAFAMRGATLNRLERLLIDDNDKRLFKEALGRLEYFKMHANFSPEWCELLKVILDGSHLRITLLEVDDCLSESVRKDLSNIYPLPELRVLSLRFPRSVCFHRADRILVAEMAFHIFPKLQQVFFWDQEDGVKWVYSRSEEEIIIDIVKWVYSRSEEEIIVDNEIQSPYVRGTFCLESKFPAAIMCQWGTMWWKCFDL